MRLSLSVPDALWLRAREAYPVSGPSQLVQTALGSMTARDQPLYREGPPPGAAGRLQQLRVRLAVEASASAQAGYAAGLHLADTLDWWVIDRLAAADWRLERLLALPQAAAVLEQMRDVLVKSHAEAARELIAEIERGPRGDVRRAATFASACLAALRDCFEDVSARVVVDEAQRARS